MGPINIRSRFDREIFRLAIPALGTLAADPLVTLVDTAFVGRLGALALGALGVNASIFGLTFAIFSFLAFGITPMVGMAVGKGDLEQAGQIAFQGVTLAALMGLAIAALLEAFARPIVIAMGATDDLKVEALKYLRIRALAAPAVLFITAGHGIFRGYQDTRTPLLITIALNLVNLVLDPIFIFTFGWGLSGAALATFIAQWSGAGCFLLLLLVTRRRQMGIHLRLPRFRELLPLLKVGGNLSVRTLSLVGTLTLATAVATRIGVLAVAAHQVGSQLRLFFSQVIDCMAIACQALVARYRGAGDERTAKAISNRALFWGVTIGLVLSALFVIFRPLLIRIFTDDPDVISAIMSIYAYIVFTQPFNAVVFVWDGVFMGAGLFNYLAKAMVLAAVVSTAVTLLALPMGWGLPGVWWGFVALMSVRALTLAIRYYSPKSIFL